MAGGALFAQKKLGRPQTRQTEQLSPVMSICHKPSQVDKLIKCDWDNVV